MVDIPIYRQQVRQAPAADTRLNLRATPDAMGAAVGEGIQSLGRAAGTVAGVTDRIMTEERQRGNDAQMARALAESTALANGLQLEYEKHQLDDAVAKRGDFEARYSKGMDDIAAKLGNDEQRAAFGNFRLKQEVAFQSAVRNRAYTEGERSYDLDFQNSRNELVRSIRINADPANGEEGLAQVQTRLEMLAVRNEALARRRGLNPEQLAELNRQDAAEAYATVINSYNEAGHSVAAKQLFDQHKDTLEPKARDALQRALELGTTKTLAQQKSAEIYSPDKTLEAMYTEADQIDDQQVQAEVKRRLDERDALRRRAIEQVQDKTFTAAYEKVKGDPRGFDALTAGERTAMGPEREERLKAWTLRRAKGEPLPWQASKAVRYQIEQTAGNPATREAFAKANLLDYIDRMNEDDFNALAALQKDVRAGKTEGADWLNTREEKVNQALAQLGMDPRPYYTDSKGKVTNNPQAVAFRAAVMQESGRLAAGNKRETPSDEDVQKAIDATIMKKVRINEWGRDPERVAATLTPEERKKAYVTIEQVPANYNDAIRAAITAAGREATDDQVQRAYAAALIGDRALYDSIIAGQ